MYFDIVEVNIGNAWQTSNNIVVIPQSCGGIYYLHLMAGAGSWNNKGIEMTLTRNGSPLFTIYHNQTQMSKGSSHEQSTITKLVTGDQLAVTMPSMVYLYSGYNARQSVFNGFRLA